MAKILKNNKETKEIAKKLADKAKTMSYIKSAKKLNKKSN